jgi:hypothetical protein
LVYLSVFVLIPYHFYCNGSSLKPALWCLQHWTFCSELLWLVEVLSVSICISRLIFLFLCRTSIEFW